MCYIQLEVPNFPSSGNSAVALCSCLDSIGSHFSRLMAKLISVCGVKFIYNHGMRKHSGPKPTKVSRISDSLTAMGLELLMIQ